MIDLAVVDAFAARVLAAGVAPLAALAITDRDRTLAVRTYGAEAGECLWQVGSITKSFTAVIAVQRVEEGRLPGAPTCEASPRPSPTGAPSPRSSTRSPEGAAPPPPETRADTRWTSHPSDSSPLASPPTIEASTEPGQGHTASPIGCGGGLPRWVDAWSGAHLGAQLARKRPIQADLGGFLNRVSHESCRGHWLARREAAWLGPELGSSRSTPRPDEGREYPKTRTDLPGRYRQTVKPVIPICAPLEPGRPVRRCSGVVA